MELYIYRLLVYATFCGTLRKNAETFGTKKEWEKLLVNVKNYANSRNFQLVLYNQRPTDVSLMLQQSVSKYKVKVKDGDKEVEEEIEIDTKEQTETYRIPKTDSGNAGEVDVVYDFKKVKYFGQVKVGVKFQ